MLAEPTNARRSLGRCRISGGTCRHPQVVRDISPSSRDALPNNLSPQDVLGTIESARTVLMPSAPKFELQRQLELPTGLSQRAVRVLRGWLSLRLHLGNRLRFLVSDDPRAVAVLRNVGCRLDDDSLRAVIADLQRIDDGSTFRRLHPSERFAGLLCRKNSAPAGSGFV